MEINEIEAIFSRIQNIQKRDDNLIDCTKTLAELLVSQNIHLGNLHKGYIALGVVNIETEGTTSGEPITGEQFQQHYNALVNEMEITLSTVQDKEVKFKRKEIIENYYAKIFDLISIRWESILAYMNLWRAERLVSSKESFNLLEEYKNLEEDHSPDFILNAEHLFKTHKDLLEFQEQKLNGEEALMLQLNDLVILRKNLIELAGQVFGE